MAEIFFNIHGVQVRMVCDDRRLLDYAGLFLRRFVCADGDSQDGQWSLNVRLDIEGRADMPTTGLSKIGSGAWCDFKLRGAFHDASTGVRCRISNTDDGLDVLASYQPSLSQRLFRSVVRRRYCRLEMYMMMVRSGLLVPALSILAHRRKCIIVHASAVASGGKGLALVGLNGCGKSGLAWRLARTKDYKILSDNFVVIDHAGRELLELSEAMRLEPSRIVPDDFTPVGMAYGKMQYAPADRWFCRSAPLAAMCLVSIGETFAARRIEPARFAGEVLAVHQSLAETPAFSCMNLFWSLTDGTSLIEREIAALNELSAQTPCYELTLPFAMSDEARYDQAADFLTRTIVL